jgi:hypothetical protein
MSTLTNSCSVLLQMYAEVVDGINLIWDNKFEEAEKLFSAKSANYPRHALHHAEVSQHYISTLYIY